MLNSDILFPTPPEVCLVFLKTWATEGYDRPSLLVDWNGTYNAIRVSNPS
jgi:beta-glucosidase